MLPDQIVDSIWLNPRSLALFQYAISEFCMHLSEEDRLALFDWTEKTSRKIREPFPAIDFEKAFLKRRQIGNYIRGLRYYVACGVETLVSYAMQCLRNRGNPMGNIWATAYVLDIGEYDFAYRYRTGYPVKNVTIACPFHEKIYNLVMWGEKRAIELPLNRFEWLRLRNARAFTWLTKILPNKEPTSFKYDVNWKRIDFLKVTIADFKRVLSSAILDEYVMSPQKMLYTYRILSGRVDWVKPDPKNAVYRVSLSDSTGDISINIGFTGCKFPTEIREGQHLTCLCRAFILSRTPYAEQSYLIGENEEKQNCGAAYVRFRRKVAKSEFVNLFGQEILDNLRQAEVVECLKDAVIYVTHASNISEDYRERDSRVGRVRLGNVHRFANDLYDMKMPVDRVYLSIESQLSPLPEYLRIAGDLFYYYRIPRKLWKEIFEFANRLDVDSLNVLLCEKCPIKLNPMLSGQADFPERKREVDLICITSAITKRLKWGISTSEFAFDRFEKFLRDTNKDLVISYDQGDMLVRDGLHIVRISSGGDIIGADRAVTEDKYELLLREFSSGPKCQWVSARGQH